MKPILTFETHTLRGSVLGPDSSLPDLLPRSAMQSDLLFDLGEEEELFEGYGTRDTSFPYPHQNSYTRVLEPISTKVAVLENDFLKATFLTQRGGRLWNLIDKTTGENLLYTNDVLRYSNLANCNAWFSGGVEWNIGIIGHTPFTARPLFCAQLQSPEGWPVLRMYEYERVRGVSYQMDFWLRPDSRALTCRMRIVNDADTVAPMYWWSNMAVPEHPGGRIIVPADAAYIYRQNQQKQGIISKVPVPMVEGVNIFQYENIARQVDYFFELSESEPHYISNINAQGYGLLHLSTNRLKSRKLFSWGNNVASDNWQAFLTDQAGHYVEIQAGLGKTQYGCLPMPPHTAWEWVEQYSAITVPVAEDPGQLRRAASKVAAQQFQCQQLSGLLESTKALAKTPAPRVLCGSEYSAFSRALCPRSPRAFSSHLDFGAVGPALAPWEKFMETGVLHQPDPALAPDAFFCEEEILQKLQKTIGTHNGENWYAHYQLGIMLLHKREGTEAILHLERSLSLAANPWASHALACAWLIAGDAALAASYMVKGCALRVGELAYYKEALRILLLSKAYKEALRLYESLPSGFSGDKRLRYYCAVALHGLERNQEAFSLLDVESAPIPDDIREGEDSVETLWSTLYSALYKKTGNLPDPLRFNSLL